MNLSELYLMFKAHAEAFEREVRAQEREDCAELCFKRAEKMAKVGRKHKGLARNLSDARGAEAVSCGSLIRRRTWEGYDDATELT